MNTMLIAQSTMDYSCKAVEDDVVVSPPSCAIILVPINSPSLLRGKGVETPRHQWSTAQSRFGIVTFSKE